MHAVATRGRWVWILSGLVVMGSVASAASAAVLRAGSIGEPGQVSVVPTRPVTIKQPITSLSVASYGAQVQVYGAPVRQTQVTEAITWDSQDAGPPAVTQSVSGGRLTLDAPACAASDCSVGFTVIAPEGVAVTVVSDGGPVTVSRVAAGNLDSGGGPVSATDVRGGLSVNSGGGSLTLIGLSGPLDADTGGGPVLARGVAARTAAVSTEGGNADIGFTTAPRTVTVDAGGGGVLLGFDAAPVTVTVNSEGGNVVLSVPGGPYAVTSNTEGAPRQVGIAVNSGASRSISVDTGGGALAIASGTGPATA